MLIRKSRILVVWLTLALGDVQAQAPPAEPRSFDLSAATNVYRLGAGDQLSIRIPQVLAGIKPMIISTEGQLTLPLVGIVQTEGLTAAQLQRRLTELYSTYLVDPEVIVSLSAARSIRVTVQGEVAQPGTYGHTPVDGKSVYGYQDLQTSQALKLAGGLKTTADLEHIVLLHRQSNGQTSRRTLNLLALLETGDTTNDLLLSDADLLLVPRRAQNTPDTKIAQSSLAAPTTIKVKILGAVQKPGWLSITPHLPLSEAIQASGGFTAQATRQVVLLRFDTNHRLQQRTVTVTDLTNPDDLLLETGDLIFVAAGQQTAAQASLWRQLQELLGD